MAQNTLVWTIDITFCHPVPNMVKACDWKKVNYLVFVYNTHL